MSTHRHALVLLALGTALAAAAAEGPSFYANFDGSATAVRCEGGPPAPTVARGLKFVPGVTGQAVFVGGHGQGPYEQQPLLEYDAGRHFAGDSGTVMFWVSPDWDGYFTDPIKFDSHFLFAAVGGRDTPDFSTRYVEPTSNAGRLWLFMWNWLRLDLYSEPGKPLPTIAWRCRNTWLRGDWWHVAFTWQRDGWSKLYVNGVPRAERAKTKLDDSQRFYVGSLPKVWNESQRANAAFDDLSITSRTLSDAEINAEFRRVAPLDFTLERRYLRAGEPEQFVVEVAPAGPPVTGTLAVRVLADSDRHAVAAQTFPLQLTKRQTLRLPLGKLPTGAYRAECTLTRPQGLFRRSFPLTVYRQQPAPPPATADLKIGERLASLDCTQPEGLLGNVPSTVKTLADGQAYREAGAAKWDRFGYEVRIPGANGDPVLMQITWPDDRERAMSWYMLPKADSLQHRDRLSGGVQCGGEYPSSGTMQTARYLFYPTEEQYLFEARTLVPNLPAAVAKVEFFRLPDRLPRLALNLPGLPGRSLGHLDEDQSFEVNFGGPQDKGFRRSELPYGYPVQVAERLLDYMDYTGQNVMSYSLARYTWSHLDEGPVNNVEDSMRSVGWVDLLLEMMGRRGKGLLANINIWTLPAQEATAADFEARVQQGYYRTDRNGKAAGEAWQSGWSGSGLGDNPSHPAVRAAFLKLVGEMLRRYGKYEAFKGLDLWCDLRAPYLYGTLDLGYDDLTIARFEQDTGIKVPAGDKPEARFAVRYAFLTGAKRAAWLAWRARQNTELLTQLDALVRRTRPDLKLQLSLVGWYDGSPEFLDTAQAEDFDFSQWSYTNLGLDMAALKKLPSVTLVPLADGTFYRWLKHWYGGRESVIGELNHNVSKFGVFRNGARSGVSLYLRYFESFMESLQQDTYKGYFQNSDPKAHDRFFLQDFALALASQDAAQILVGAQPLGTMGRDAATREFAAAYRALPVGNFQPVRGLTDPVTARYLNTAAGTYLYAVNMLWSPLTVTVNLPAGGTVTDLSSGKPVPASGGKLVVALQPFQLRSFRLAGKAVRPSGGSVTVPAATREWFAAQVRDLQPQVAALAASGADVAPQQQRFALIQAHVQAGRYAEAHRLLCSKLIRGLPEFRQAAADGSLKQQAAMIARGEYAVDCGGAAFLRTKAGRLFFPDHKYAVGGYGYDGKYQSVARPTVGLTGSDDPALFATEAYDLDAYRFTVKPGKYTVRLYLKIGYEPGFKPGVFVLNVNLEGQPALSELDLFAAVGGDFSKTLVREFRDVDVRDGVLDVEFSIPPGRGIDPTARLCDAIEVIPQP